MRTQRQRLAVVSAAVHGPLGPCTQFGIDGCEPYFWGYAERDRRWNGWAIPWFRTEVIQVMMSVFNDIHDIHDIHDSHETEAVRDTWDIGPVRDAENADGIRLWWSGEVLMVNDFDTGEPVPSHPDDAGRYRFDGWTWLEKP